MKNKPAKSTVGARLVARLKRFTKELSENDQLPERFTTRTLKLDLEPGQYRASTVKETRELLGISQPLFAQFLGVSKSAVRDWEQGLKPPSGAAARMMDEIRRNPEYFRGRLREMAVDAS
jgi:putative transcriptional regulator